MNVLENRMTVSLPEEKEFYASIGLHAFLLASWLIAPFAGLFFIFACLYYVNLSRREFIWYVFLAASYPALINITKQPVSDLLVYSGVYVSHSDVPFLQFFQYFNTDYLFHFIDLVLGKISGANVAVFVAFWSIFTYFLVMWTQVKCYEWLPQTENGKRDLVLLLGYTLFAGLLFGLSAHLMREYPAGALLMLALSCWAFDKKYHIPLYIGAVLIHFSLLLLLPIYPLWRYFGAKSLRAIPVIMLVAFVAGSANVFDAIIAVMGKSSSIGFFADILSKASAYVSKDDGQASLLAWMRLALFGLFAVYLLYKHGKKSEPLQKFVFAMLYLLTALILFRNTSLLLLRYFYYTDFFNMILLVFAICYENRNPFLRIALIGVALISPFKFVHDIHNLYMVYIDNSYYIAGYSVFDFLQAIH